MLSDDVIDIGSIFFDVFMGVKVYHRNLFEKIPTFSTSCDKNVIRKQMSG